MPIRVDYVYNCACDRGPPERISYTEAVDSQAQLVSGELRDYYLFLTSRPYPVEAVDGIDVAADVVSGLFLSGYIEGLDNAADIVSGALRVALLSTTMDPEAIDASADVVSGTLRPVLKSYTMLTEGCDMSADVVSGAIRSVLVATIMNPEGVDVSATIVSGSLT